MLRIEIRLPDLDKRYEGTKESKVIYLGQWQCSRVNRKHKFRLPHLQSGNLAFKVSGYNKPTKTLKRKLSL